MLKLPPIINIPPSTGPTFPFPDDILYPEDILPGPTSPSPEDIDRHNISIEPSFSTFDDSLINVGTPPYNPFPDEGTTTVASEEEDDGPLSPTLQGLLDEAGKIIDDFVDSLPDWTVPEDPADHYGPSPIHLSPGPTSPSPEDIDRHNISTEPSFSTFDDSLINVGTPPYNPFPDEGTTTVASLSLPPGLAGLGVGGAAAAGALIGRKLDDLLGSNENGNDNYSDDLSDEYIELIGPAPDWMLDIF